MVSCNDDTEKLDDIKIDLAEFTLSIKYKDAQYEVPGKLDENGDPIYFSKEFNDLYENRLSKFPNLVTLVTGHNNVEYYESMEELFEEREI